jgi:hypothetical protein
MKSRLIVFAIAAAIVSSAAAYAHHSFAGTYREDETVTIEGEIIQFNVRNPHSFINIEVTNADGEKELWGGEWGSVTQLSQGGVNRFTLKAGEFIVVDGAPARETSDNRVLVRRVVRPATGPVEEFVWSGRVD